MITEAVVDGVTYRAAVVPLGHRCVDCVACGNPRLCTTLHNVNKGCSPVGGQIRVRATERIFWLTVTDYALWRLTQ